MEYGARRGENKLCVYYDPTRKGFTNRHRSKDVKSLVT